MALREVVAGNVDSLKGLAGGVVVGVGALAAGFSLHESIETDEQGIILKKGRVKLDREKLKEDFGSSRVGRARKRILEEAAAKGESPLPTFAEYAKIHNHGGHFKFFSLRSLRKIPTNDQISGLPAQRIRVGSEVHTLDSSVTWAIEPVGQNAARALLRARSLAEISKKVVATTAAVAREAISGMEPQEPPNIFSSSLIFDMILENCGERLQSRYGAVLLDYEVSILERSADEQGRRIIFEGPNGEQIPPDEVEPHLRIAPVATAGA